MKYKGDDDFRRPHGVHHGCIRVRFSSTMMRSARRTGPSGSTAADTLSLVLRHLSSSEDSDDLCHRAARDLHRVSKQHQAEARATLRHLPLHRYCNGIILAELGSDVVPWELLAACPKATSWKLHPDQLEKFQWGLGDDVAAAASRVKRLEVHGLDGANYGQQKGLGVLLWACKQLEEVQITSGRSNYNVDALQNPWLLLDPDSSSLDTATAPPLPLRSWASRGVGHRLLAAWTAQQPLAPTLRCLELRDSHDGTGMSWATALTSLQELTLDTLTRGSLESAVVSSMSSLTRLQLTEGFGINDDTLSPLTSLRHLVVNHHLPSAITALKQLTALQFNYAYDLSLPPDLGAWLPRLEQLVAKGSTLAAVPATLSRLTRLDLSGNTAAALTLPSTLTRLRELGLSEADSTAVASISSFTALEVLDVANSRVLGESLTVLQPLTRLRHLSMAGARGCDPASFTVLATLQQLTRLDLARSRRRFSDEESREGGITAACCGVLAGTPPPPALAQLDISYYKKEHLAALGPWVGALPALISIKMKGCAVGEDDMLLFLPSQLQEVDMSSSGLYQLPPGLQRLSALEVLDVSCNGSLCELPGWLSQLRCLEAMRISVCGMGVPCAPEVLAHMPALRYVQLPRLESCGVFNKAPHLYFGHSSRFTRCRW
jgi:Leucine-rich repeat (LRR) protein